MTTWEDERREVVERVLAELWNPALDSEGRAAGTDLLIHLARSRGDYAGGEGLSFAPFPAGCSSRSNNSESRGAISVRPPKRHWL